MSFVRLAVALLVAVALPIPAASAAGPSCRTAFAGCRTRAQKIRFCRAACVTTRTVCQEAFVKGRLERRCGKRALRACLGEGGSCIRTCDDSNPCPGDEQCVGGRCIMAQPCTTACGGGCCGGDYPNCGEKDFTRAKYQDRMIRYKDTAYTYANRAVLQKPRFAAAHEVLARIWRDWGLPRLGIGPVSRAIYFNPASASAENTLGTLLDALAQPAEARWAFARAVAVDPRAAYALSNLCRAWRLEGNASKAADACQHALQLQPGLEPARNNLALAYEAAGDLPSALATLGASTDAARAAYNKGLLHLARREYRDALQSFDVARAERPRFREAEAIARQVRAHLREGNQP